MTTLRGILPVFPATDKATGKRRGVPIGPDHAIVIVAAVCLATLPLAWLLAPLLPTHEAGVVPAQRRRPTPT